MESGFLNKAIWTMLETNGYDTVCHEHLEYYSLAQIKWMTDRTDAKIVDVEFNDVNGGSFSVVVAKACAPQPEMPELPSLLARERSAGLGDLAPYRAFAERTARSRRDLRKFFDRTRSEGKTVGALGASTKGNVLLQYCDVTEADICCVGEVNPQQIWSLHARHLDPNRAGGGAAGSQARLCSRAALAFSPVLRGESALQGTKACVSTAAAGNPGRVNVHADRTKSLAHSIRPCPSLRLIRLGSERLYMASCPASLPPWGRSLAAHKKSVPRICV